EWGSFNILKTTKYDIELDKRSWNCGHQIMEKMVSGMYLGEVARLVLKDLIRKGLIFDGMSSPAFDTACNFRTEYMSRVEGDTSIALTGVSRLLNQLGIKRPSLDDRKLVKKICKIVGLRAARVSAAAIAAVVTKMDPALSRNHTVAIDGSVYEKYPGFAGNIKAALLELFGKRSSRIKLRLAKDGSGKGAAIIAAVA
ncbi:MAG: hexokinase, partial [Candidatus Omnitrophota bacterium]